MWCFELSGYPPADDEVEGALEEVDEQVAVVVVEWTVAGDGTGCCWTGAGGG